jgi:lipopolysaccharide/colanic/teichoic acid biosynthesis glycosyltransferase
VTTPAARRPLEMPSVGSRDEAAVREPSGRLTEATPDRQLAPSRPLTRLDRAFDLAVCLLVLPGALVIGAITALLIYVDSPGPIFYRSTRVGHEGREFRMLKFRKMLRSARGGPLTVANDERFTPIGQFLSLTKLDELPQLWNVLRGEMRLVGPRPEVPEFVHRYQGEYAEILTVLPGITGPAAVAYASESHVLALQQDPLRYYAESIMPHKIEIDREYVSTRSLPGDAGLLLRTALIPFGKVGRQMIGNPRVRRVEAVVFGVVGSILVIAFAIAGAG